MTENILHNDQLLVCILRSESKSEGIHFFTPDNFSQQLAYMNRPAAYEIAPHVHNHIERTVHFTQEVLFIRSGRCKLDVYDDAKNFLQSVILKTGDVVLLAGGGHGITMLEATEIVEVKQGPYLGEQDKTRFEKSSN